MATDSELLENSSIDNVKVIYSNRRERTISAKLNGKEMVVYAPENISSDRLNKIIEKFKSRFNQRKLSQKQDLKIVFDKLNQNYFDSILTIHSIEYATDLNSKFGWCDYRAKRIRISQRLISMPTWVRDYVVIHEMAHLIEPNHSEKFYDIVNRYKLAERARGYLMAKSCLQEEDENI